MNDKNAQKPSACSHGTNPGGDQSDQILKDNMNRIKHKIVVLSGKGGVGKSTVAVNLAVSLAAKGLKVGLLDVDIHGPSVPKLLGLDGTMAMGGGEKIIYPVKYSDNLIVMSVGFLMADADEAVVWRGPLKYGIIKQFLSDVVWGDLDYLIVDSPPGTGDEPLSVCQLIPDPDGAVIVTTPQDVALADVRKSVTFCRQLKMNVIGVIENMSTFVCPHCGETTDIFKTGGGESMADNMGVNFLGKIPLEPHIVHSGDSGNPFSMMVSDEKSFAMEKFSTIVDSIIKGEIR
jgi:Mrp family chromosome partitioning ATPase